MRKSSLIVLAAFLFVSYSMVNAQIRVDTDGDVTIGATTVATKDLDVVGNTYFNGNVYTGMWKNGKREGMGTYILSKNSRFAGNRYAGHWENDMMHGNGTYYYSGAAAGQMDMNNGPPGWEIINYVLNGGCP